MKSFFSSVVTAALCLCSFAFVSCDKNENKTPDPLTFSVTKAEVEVGKTVEVTVKNGTQPFTVKSSDEKIATVKVEKEKITVTGEEPTEYFHDVVKVEKEKITVTGVAGGTATISVVDKNQTTGSFTVTVKAAAEKLEFDKAEVTVGVEKEEVVTVKSGTAPYTVKVTDAAVATAIVKEAAITVKGVKAGTTTLTVTDKDGKTGEVAIKVE